MISELSIGIDGGGTGCRVLIRDARTGRTAMGEGGPANVASDFAGAIHHVTQALDHAARKLGVTSDQIYGGVAHIGLAGIYDDVFAANVREAMPFQNMTVSDDRVGAVEGVLAGQNGYLVVAGTGMIVASSMDGVQRFVGGHGFQVSDHASGAWIGRQLLDFTLRCHDGMRPHSALTHKTLAKFGTDPAQIVAFSLTAPPSDYAVFAPDVIAAGQAGDKVAVDILTTGAAHIFEGLSALGFQAGDRLCLAGGVGGHYVSYLADGMTDGLTLPQGSALDGALRLAERLRFKLTMGK